MRQSGGQATELRQPFCRMQAGGDFIALAAGFQGVVDGVQKAPEFRSGAGDDLVGKRWRNGALRGGKCRARSSVGWSIRLTTNHPVTARNTAMPIVSDVSRVLDARSDASRGAMSNVARTLASAPCITGEVAHEQGAVRLGA